MHFTGFGVGGTDEARGRGGNKAYPGCALSVGGSGYGAWVHLPCAECLVARL